MKERYPWVRKGIRVLAGITLLATGFMAGEALAKGCLGNFSDTVQAATAIEERNDCSLSIVIPEDSEYYKDTEQPGIKVRLYRVAKVTADCRFVVDEEVTDCGIDIQKLVENGSSSAWSEKAALAAKNLKGENPYKTGNIIQGKCKFQGLQTGMYLVAPEPAKSKNYEYTFSPYFVSLPGNLYIFTGTDDVWLYHVESYLKVSTCGTDLVTPPKKVSKKTVIQTVKTGDQTELMALILCAAGSLIILIINVVQLVRKRGQEELG